MNLHVGELLRALGFEALRPASALLPRSWAYGLADLIGLCFALAPVGARVRRSMRAAFPAIGAAGAAKMAHEWLARPFRDHVNAARVHYKRQDPQKWRIVSTPPAIALDPHQSIIIATGHFSREAMSLFYLPNVVPKPLAMVIASLDRGAGTPLGWRLRIQFDEMLKGINVLRRGGLDVFQIGEPNLVSNLVHHLKVPGNAIVMSSDAGWPRGSPGGFERPFAGHASVCFALGTARLSRLTQCPIVTCVPYLDEEGRFVLEWGEVIPAPARKDASADVRLTSQILDELEIAVGRRPSQYVLAIGHERSWDPATEKWTPIEGGGEKLAPASDFHEHADAYGAH